MGAGASSVRIQRLQTQIQHQASIRKGNNDMFNDPGLAAVLKEQVQECLNHVRALNAKLAEGCSPDSSELKDGVEAIRKILRTPMPTNPIVVSSSSADNETTPNLAANPDAPPSCSLQTGEQAKSVVEEQKSSKLEAEASAPRSWVCLCGVPNCTIFHGAGGAGEGAAAAPDAEPAAQVPAQLASMAVCAAQLDDEAGVSLNLTLDECASGKGPTLLLRRQGTNKMEADALVQDSAGVKPPAEGADAPAAAPAVPPAAITELEPAGGFVFPAGYITREYSRDVLSRVEQRYFDDMEETKDPAKARVVLDKIDLCHQAGIHNYDDITAFLEGRASFEELVRTQAEIAEARQKQLEQQRILREREKSQRAVALELPVDIEDASAASAPAAAVEAPQQPLQQLEEQNVTTSVETQPAGGFVFPAGYVTREYSRDVLSRVEQRYFDDMEETKDPAKARVVLDKIDLCHQAGIHNYDDITAFLEGRASFEELVKTQAEIAEARQKQLEQQRILREREKSQRAVALELPDPLDASPAGGDGAPPPALPVRALEPV